MPDTLTITDNRTGQQYEVPIAHGIYPEYGSYIRAADLKKIKLSPNDFGLLSYDPAFMNTASTKSTVTHIDGDGGICGIAATRSTSWRRRATS
jgi:citrate synthase